MTDDEARMFAVRSIRRELAASGIKVNRIILFGSRARGTADADSDWDFLVSIGSDLPFAEKAEIVTAIQRRLAVRHMAVDIIIKSEDSILNDEKHVGLLTHYALKEGIAL